MKVTFRVLISVVILFIVTWFSPLYGNDNTPDSVVKKYYQADLDGARLSAEGYRKIKPLILWEHEPGWDLVFVTKGARIDKTGQLRTGEIYVTVFYEVLGILTGDELLEIEFTQVVTFNLIKKNGQWKIKQPVIFPHVSQLALSKHMEDVLKENQDKKREARLNLIIKRLREL